MSKPALELLGKITKHNALAHNAYARYSWTPHTTTGQKALDRYEHHFGLYADAVAKLRELLITDPEPPKSKHHEE